MAPHSSVLAWRIPGRWSLVGCRLWGRTELDTTEATYQQQQQAAQMVKNLPADADARDAGLIPSLGRSLKRMATHSSIPAWEIPWTKKPGGLQSMESQRVRHY